ncbi:MAG TPA: hypothetical protein VLM89_12630 [Phycisphaerae bacterium]|nr:hypothetical protein [Phycisphaerae bacterium]
MTSPLWAGETPAPLSADYLQTVRTFADNVLQHGRDVYGPRHTPLFVDGINVDTHEPPVWHLAPDYARAWNMPTQWIMSNLACQQVLFRVFDALTTLTGEAGYRQAAIDAFRYHFEHLQYRDGLLAWGGHAMIDAATEQPVGECLRNWRMGTPITPFWDIGVEHELKHHYPHYDLMWRTDPEATRRFIEGFWSAHVLRWDVLDFNRHGLYGRDKGCPWDRAYVGGTVHFEGGGLSLMDAGVELMYAAVELSRFTGDARPLAWAKRLAQRYADARDPKTGLGPDVYSHYRNGRLAAQFDGEMSERVSETKITSIYGIRYGYAAVCQLKLAEMLWPAGDEFLHHATADLTAFARHAFDPADGRWWFMLTDGTRLESADVKRAGPLPSAHIRKRSVGPFHFWGYVLAYKLTGDASMWKMARRIGQLLDLGDIGQAGGKDSALRLTTTARGAYTIFALLDLFEATGKLEYLALARRLGDNALAAEFDRGFFVPGKSYVMSSFDTVTPLALLYIEAASREPPVKLPLFLGNQSHFMCPDETGERAEMQTVFGVQRKYSPDGGF